MGGNCLKWINRTHVIFSVFTWTFFPSWVFLQHLSPIGHWKSCSMRANNARKSLYGGLCLIYTVVQGKHKLFSPLKMCQMPEVWVCNRCIYKGCLQNTREHKFLLDNISLSCVAKISVPSRSILKRDNDLSRRHKSYYIRSHPQHFYCASHRIEIL